MLGKVEKIKNFFQRHSIFQKCKTTFFYIFLYVVLWSTQYYIFQETILLYWLSGFCIYILYNLFTPFLRSKFSWAQLHTVNLFWLFNLWLISWCVLSVSIVYDQTFLVKGSWEDVLVFNIAWGAFFYFDTYSTIFLVLILTISLYVLPYSSRYLNNEPTSKKFYFCLNGFIIGMILLVVSNQFFLILLGWELIGWFSFFLIANYTLSAKAQFAAYKVLSFNKFSDTGVLLAVCIFLNYHNIGLVQNTYFWGAVYDAFNSRESNLTSYDYCIYGLLVASFVKSAHFGLHLWLPDSMEAPIPASALIHSATLVSAGVYIVGRLNPVLTLYPNLYDFILVWASCTAFVGALVASYQTDLKKTLAYSTISHCGFLMILALNPDPRFLYIYLCIHGVLKSFSFIIGGDLILTNHNYQDWRRAGGNFLISKFKYILLLVSMTGLSGLPFAVGFWGKNTFLVLSVTGDAHLPLLNHFCLVGASLFGLLYCFRILFFVFFHRTLFLSNRNSLLQLHTFVKVNPFDLYTKQYYIVRRIFWVGSVYLIILYIITLGLALGVISLEDLGSTSEFFVTTTKHYMGTYGHLSPNAPVMLVYVNIYVIILAVIWYKYNSKLSLWLFPILTFFALINGCWFLF